MTNPSVGPSSVRPGGIDAFFPKALKLTGMKAGPASSGARRPACATLMPALRLAPAVSERSTPWPPGHPPVIGKDIADAARAVNVMASTTSLTMNAASLGVYKRIPVIQTFKQFAAANRCRLDVPFDAMTTLPREDPT